MIIGISGKAQSGKGEFSLVAQELFDASVISFAAGVKEEAAQFLADHGAMFEQRHLYGTRDDKEERLYLDARKVDKGGRFFIFFLDFLAMPGVELVDSIASFTPRLLMQWWGTEYRRTQDPDYWVKKSLAKCSDPHALYVIDDVRFPNEAAAIQMRGEWLGRVERPDRPPCSNDQHPSETALDNWRNWDFYLTNDGSIETYRLRCALALRQMLSGEAPCL